MTGNQNLREDRVTARGVFLLRVFKNGDLVETYEDHNLIVDLGRTNLAELLGGDSVLVIEKIAVGTNGADPVLSDTAITGVFSKAVTATTYPAVGTVQFDWSIETSEANGMTIREFGLLLSDDSLFSRKNRAPIVKDNTFRLEGVWKIIF